MRTDYSYIGSGKVYFKRNDVAGGLLELGNVSKLSFGVEEETVSQRDYTTAGGGTKNEVRRVKNVSATMTLGELKPANVALMLYGTANEVEAGSITDESIVGYTNALSRLAHASPSSVTVKDETKVTTYTAGTDYEVRPGGIFILDDGAIADGDLLKVSYDYGAEDVIEALTSSAKEYQLFFEGINEAQSGDPFLVDAYRVRFGASKAFDLIGDNFASYEVSGSVLKDSSKTGDGVSPFFKATSLK